MKRYILKIPYPGSPVKDTIYTKAGGVYQYYVGEQRFFASINHVENNRNWVPYEPMILNIPFGSFIIFKKQPLKIYEILEAQQYNKVILLHTDSNVVYTQSIFYINDLFDNQLFKIFETLEEATEELIFNTPLLSINDIATIYTSAKNPNYQQSEELITLIKSKL